MIIANTAYGQRSQAVFGQSRVQYDNFKWRSITTPHFEIFYYQKGAKLAKSAAEYAEKDYARIAELLGYYSYRKIKLIVYNSIADQHQSNIGLSVEKYQTGSETKYIKNKIEIAFASTQIAFKQEVALQLTRVLIKEMVYGSGMKDLIQSSYFISLPEWFSEGLAHYATYGWSIEMDNYMRVGKVPATMSVVDNLKGERAIYVGQSIWNYIGEEYGTDIISSVINFARLARDERMSISNTLGVDYKEFYTAYKDFYDKSTSETLSSLEDVNSNERIISNRYNSNYFKNIALSNDGNKVAYSINDQGKIKVYIKNLTNGRTKKVFKKGIKNTSQTKDESLPILTWRNNKELYIVYRSDNEWSFMKDGKLLGISGNNLILRNLTGKGRRKNLKGFEQVQSISFSDDGQQLLLSVVRDGQSDLFLFVPKLKKTLQLTNDFYDDIDPVFTNDDKILFSSNRLSNDEGLSEGSASEIVNNFDIFKLDAFSDTNRIKQLTDGIANESIPKTDSLGNIYYLSDATGIRSLYKFNSEDNSSGLVKTYEQNIIDYDVKGEVLTISSQLGKGSGVYLEREAEFNTIESPIKTERQKIIEKRTIIVEVDTNKTTVLPKVKTKLKKGKPYGLTFSVNKIRSGLKADPLFGFGAIFDISMTDLMENHRINGGIFVLSDLGSTSIYGEYEYLKKRADFKLKYERQNYIFYSDDGPITAFNRTVNLFNISSQKASGIISYPFNNHLKVEGDFGWYRTNVVLRDGFSLQAENLNTNFSQNGINFVFDNTINQGLNMLKGTRFKMSLYSSVALSASDSITSHYSDENFTNFNFDLRKYTEIFRKITWANRLTFGRSMGNSPKTFIFGSMDNEFITARTEINEIPPYLYGADILNLNYVTSMRGFNYNVRNGNNYFLFNSELRLPYKKLTSLSTYKSNFVNNLQFVFFSDLGTAWSGLNPFSKDNSLNVTQYGGNGSAFEITARNYRSSLIMGFGGGVRTVVLGTYVKFDLGWGIEDFEISLKPKGHLTLGYDF